jgi:hypothetical protein
MMLADRLHKSIKEVMEMTALEIQMWAGYITYENQEKQKTMNASRSKTNQTRGR